MNNEPVVDQENILETLIQYIGEFDSVEDCINWILIENSDVLDQLDVEKKKILAQYVIEYFYKDTFAEVGEHFDFFIQNFLDQYELKEAFDVLRKGAEEVVGLLNVYLSEINQSPFQLPSQND